MCYKMTGCRTLAPHWLRFRARTRARFLDRWFAVVCCPMVLGDAVTKEG